MKKILDSFNAAVERHIVLVLFVVSVLSAYAIGHRVGELGWGTGNPAQPVVVEQPAPSPAPAEDEEPIIEAKPVMPAPSYKGLTKAAARDLRYATENAVVWRYHTGGESIDPDELRDCVRRVLAYLPHVDTSAERVELLMETAAAESMLGRFNIPGRAKAARGVWQVLPATAEDTFSWLRMMRKTHGDVLDALESLMDRKFSVKENLEWNVPFSCAMAATVYWRMATRGSIATREDRGRLWLTYYNTPGGGGSMKAWLARAGQCLGPETED